ncbi:hypothetical protein EOC99_29855, partial [Mesorhizobium sp. M7A.T.Ca.TU.009.01.1.1]
MNANAAASPFSPFTGRRCRQADEGQRRRRLSAPPSICPENAGFPVSFLARAAFPVGRGVVSQ